MNYFLIYLYLIINQILKIMKKVNILFKTSALMLGVLFVLGSCNSANKETTDTAAAPVVEATPPAAPAPAPLTDPEIASIAVTANQIDIDYANIAKSKASNADVKKFAATMIKDHQSVLNQAVALAKKLGVTPQDNPTTQALLAGSVTAKDMLNSKTGSDFDKAYVDNEVSYHKAAIDLVENTLIKDATNPELKSLLESALPIFKEHLSHAEMVQKELNK